MSVIGDIRSAIMATIQTATGITPVVWDGDPQDMMLTLDGIGVHWHHGIDSEAMEITDTGGVYVQSELFLILFTSGSQWAESVFDHMESISVALNGTEIASNIYTEPAKYFENGATKAFIGAHGGQALWAMAVQATRIAT